MKDHLFVSSDGTLFDTRDSDWNHHPLRANYSVHHRTIESVADFKACLRAGNTTDLGGYPLYFITSDGAALSFESAQKEFRQIAESIATKARDGWRIVACEINYEDSDLFCWHSGKRIPSAYGDDESEVGQTFTIDTTRDREGNEMFRVSVCQNDETIAEQDFYELESAENWLADNFPNAEKD